MTVSHEAIAHELYLELPSFPGRFGLRLTDDAMADALLCGDVVLLTQGPYRLGDVYAVRVGASPPLLVYIDTYPNHPERVVLRFHNADWEPLEVDTQDMRIDGVCCGLLRGDVIEDLI